MCALLLPYGPWMANRVATLQHDRTKKSRFCYVAELDSWHFFQGKEPLLGGLTPQQFSPINVNLKGDTFGPNFDLLPNKMISGFQIHFCYVPFCWTKDPIFCWFSSPTILEVFLFPFMGFSSQRCMWNTICYPIPLTCPPSVNVPRQGSTLLAKAGKV